MSDPSAEDTNTQEEIQPETTTIPSSAIFTPPSIHNHPLLRGESYTHHTPLPTVLTSRPSTPCVLGIDEAGRGPVLGPMVYGAFYLPLDREKPLLKETHSFMDSKVLTPTVRANLMRTLCTPGTDLHSTCGWAVRVMSARDIGAGMMGSAPGYNLNAQAMDATVGLIRGVIERGVDVREIYVDTVGAPKVYQERLQRVFPTARVTVEKKADSIYACVSAASVVAKVTRDVALEGMWVAKGGEGEGWGSGYPSDKRTTVWMKENMDEVFGWGNECRFSWGTAKEMLEKDGRKVDWPEEEEEEEQGMKVTNYFVDKNQDDQQGSELAHWFGRPATEAVF